MKTTALSIVAALTVLAAALPAESSAVNRAWVSGHGVDQAGCGAPTAPCRSLQYTHDHIVATGGEIDILDPAGYGAITITKAISIVNDGVGTAGVQAASGNAITINTSAGASVYLRGLNIDGEQDAAANGIVFSAGGALSVVNCVVRHFSGAGIAVTANLAIVTVSGTLSADNGGEGVLLGPVANQPTNIFATLAGDQFHNNGFGVEVSSGAASAGVVQVSIFNSIANSNVNDGLQLIGNPAGPNVRAIVDLSQMDGNTNGVAIDNNAVVHVSRSDFSQNGSFGISNGIANNVLSTGDNRAVDNGAGAVGGVTPTNDPLL